MSLLLRHAVILACLFGSAAAVPADMIVINAMRAVPRWGNSQCWVDTGARLKNTCATAQLLSFMPEQYLFGKTVTSHVITDAPFAELKCQHVSLKDWGLSNYWTLGPSQSNTHSSLTGTGEVYLPPWLVKSLLYQIDCQVPPGAQVIGAVVEWY